MRPSDYSQSISSRYHLEEVLLYLHHHPYEFEEFFKLIFNEKTIKPWRFLWVVEKVSQRTPEWLDEDKLLKIRNLILTSDNYSIIRLSLSILKNYPIENPIDVNMLNRLYDVLLSSHSPYGVKASAMKLLLSYCKTDEFLLSEFVIILQNMDDELYAPSFIAAKRNVLASI